MMTKEQDTIYCAAWGEYQQAQAALKEAAKAYSAANARFDRAAKDLASANNTDCDCRNEELKAALTTIIEVASGAEQVADDDTGGLAWIDKFARRALTAFDGGAEHG